MAANSRCLAWGNSTAGRPSCQSSVILVAEGLVFADQLLTRSGLGVLGRDGGVDLAGLIIDGLTTTVGSTCLGGDGAMSVAEAGGRVGDPTHTRLWCTWGVELRGSGACHYSHSDDPPLLQIKTNLVKASQLSSLRTRFWAVLG